MTKGSLQSLTRGLAGSDYSASAIKAAEVKFEKILRTLQMQMDDSPIGGLDANGLGYNNLLYMAVVFEHLKDPDPDESPLFLIRQEPEAHLHPQLTMLLADANSANKTPGESTPQSNYTLADPGSGAFRQVAFMCCSLILITREVRCNSVAKAGMNEIEQGQLQRMLDITRATSTLQRRRFLLKASRKRGPRACEAASSATTLGQTAHLSDPDLRRGIRDFQETVKTAVRSGFSCRSSWWTQTPGLALTLLGKMPPLNPPMAVSSDPNARRSLSIFFVGTKWSEFSAPSSHSNMTLPRLVAGMPWAMAEVWESCFVAGCTFNRAWVTEAGEIQEAKALAAWRGICRAEHSVEQGPSCPPPCCKPIQTRNG